MSDKARMRGILGGGYGFVAKKAMKDTRLSIEAKAIYAYLCSYSGGDGGCFPSVGLMAYELGVSEARLKKHRQQLVDLGYISIERRRQDGKQASNLYVIEVQPKCFQTPEKQTPQNLPSENLTPENVGTTKNSSTKNSLTSNNEEITPAQKPKKPVKHRHGMYGNVLLTDSELSKLQTEFPTDWQARIDRLSEYVESTGKSYKSHLATIRAWARREAEERRRSAPKPTYDDSTPDMENWTEQQKETYYALCF